MTDGDDPADCGIFEVKANTGRAILVEDEAGKTWVPVSQICDESELDADSEPGDEGELVLPEWLAVEKGFV